MDKFKPIISHQEGQNLFPGIPTVIKGDKSSTNITMKNTKDQIALTPYGASYMTPGQDYAFAGNTVAELPMAQMGGEDPEQDQIMQILQVYAQMKQIPIEELMQQLQSLPEDQQQQALSSIVQDVQKTMQEQQMGQQQQPEMGQQDQQGMMEQEQEMPMAMHGGEPCIDCEEQFPQAQNLNWFYKAQAGTQVKTLSPEQQAAANQAFARLEHYQIRGQGNELAQKDYQDQLVNFFGNPQYDIVSKVDSLNKVYPKVTTWGNGSYGDEVKWDKIYNPENPAIKNVVYRRRSISGANPQVFKEKYPEEYALPINQPNPYFVNPSYGKAQGGEAFPQANPYPHMYAQGGEAFHQAQTYLPYDRGGNPVPNFMFQQGGDLDQYGGSTDIDQAYQMMKRGGFDMNPKKKKGGKFDAGSFQDYVMKNGGYLPKHQVEEATIGQNLSQPSGSYNTWGSPTIPTAVSQSPAFQQVQDYNANATRIADQNVVKQGTDQMGYKPSNSTYPKQNPKTSMYNLFSQAFPTKPKRQNVVGAGLKALASAVDFGGSMYNGKGLFPAQQGGLPKHQSEGPVRFQQTPSVNWSSEILDDGQLSNDQLWNAYTNSYKAYGDVSGFENDTPYEFSNNSSNQTKDKRIGMNMPKTPNPISQFKPQAGPWNDYNTGTMTNDINSVINEPMTLKKNQSFFGGQDAQGNSIYNFDKIPDTGITSNQQQQEQQKRGLGFNTPFAARQVSNLNNIGGFLQGINELKAEDKERAKGINSSAWMPVQQSNDRGDYMNNNGMFRPNDYQYSQSAPGMQNQQAFYAQAGGPLDMFEDGEEYDLDENTINLILAMGGSVEYL